MTATIRPLTIQTNAHLVQAINNGATTLKKVNAKFETNVKLTTEETLIFLLRLSEAWKSE